MHTGIKKTEFKTPYRHNIQVFCRSLLFFFFKCLSRLNTSAIVSSLLYSLGLWYNLSLVSSNLHSTLSVRQCSPLLPRGAQWCIKASLGTANLDNHSQQGQHTTTVTHTNPQLLPEHSRAEKDRNNTNLHRERNLILKPLKIHQIAQKMAVYLCSMMEKCAGRVRRENIAE